MADDIAISVEGLSKRYLIGHRHAATETFREMLGRRARGVGRSLADLGRGRQLVRGDTVEEFWALRDVSFTVHRGEVLGVIGRNGAGKSTLLKILSRITEPTEGRVVIRGRVSSLLEVGTGFHPELTGRENIFLNGAILGMTRAEIVRKFDEIVAFAEVERFLDTPVKRYSSGMYVRLAFAVAAHLEPEILIIDEVLAVGDVLFQKKCLGKMRDVAQQGRTVIFVSHNLPAVINLTEHAILIEAGRVTLIGPTRQIVAAYLRESQESRQTTGDLSTYRTPNRIAGHVDIHGAWISGADLGERSFEVGEAIAVDIELSIKQRVETGIVVINIMNDEMEILASLVSSDNGFDFALNPGRHVLRCNLGVIPLAPGNYMLNIGIASATGALAWDVVKGLPGFTISGAESAAWLKWPDRPGSLFVRDCRWTMGVRQ